LEEIRLKADATDDFFTLRDTIFQRL